MVQIRNMPDDLHRRLKVRSAEAGVSLSDYLLSEIAQAAEKPTLKELGERLRSAGPIRVEESPAAVVRRHRDAG